MHHWMHFFKYIEKRLVLITACSHGAFSAEGLSCACAAEMSFPCGFREGRMANLALMWALCCSLATGLNFFIWEKYQP